MHKISSSIDVAARMVVVGAFLVLMPFWAAGGSRSRLQQGEPRDVAKLVSGGEPICRLPKVPPPTRDEFHSKEGCSPRSESPESDQEATLLASAMDEPAIRALQTRLQQMGAEYLLLERLGGVGPGATGTYRFFCRMPIATNPMYARTFESFDDDATMAMRRVVQDVELWQGAARGDQ